MASGLVLFLSSLLTMTTRTYSFQKNMGPPRKRARSSAAGLLMVARPYKRPRRTASFIPGVDRTGGFYGRYSGRDSELKFHDVNITDAIVAATGQITDSVNKIPQGVTESERVGRKCTLKSINWHWQATLPEVDAVMTPAGSDSLRLVVYLDKQCNGATAGVTDLLEAANWLQFRNLSNSGRFNFLMDKTVVLNYSGLASDGAGVVSQGDVLRDGSFYKSCNIPIEFSSTTGAIGEIRSNNIGILLISSAGLVGFDSKMRLRFSDQ